MEHPISHFFLKFKYWIALVFFGVIIGFVGDSCIIKRVEQLKEISMLKEEINVYKTQFENDKALYQRLKNDPEAIKEVARERYYMKTADEDIFVIKDND